MLAQWKKHKTGMHLLQVLHKLDNKAILVSASSSILDTFIFYAGLIFSARIIDDLLLQMWKKAALHTVFLIVFNLALGVLKNQISKIFFQKYQMLYTDLKILTRKKVLSMSFQQFENPEITKKIYLSERTMDMYGGLDEVLYLYQQLFHSIISGIIAVGMVIHMCFIRGEQENGSIIVSGVSFLMVVCLTMKATIFSNTYFVEQQNKIYEEHGDAEENLSYYMDKIYGNKEVNKVCHLYDMKEMILKNFKEFLNASSGLYQRMRVVKRKQELSGQGISLFFTLYSYGLILFKIGTHAISIGSFSQYAGAMTRFMTDMTNIVWINGEIAKSCKFMQGLIDFLETDEKFAKGKRHIEIEKTKYYEIEFLHVSFHYPDNEILILDDVSCKINSNSKIAIVGKNGAGKTTFIKLLCGLYYPTKGKITLNGIDIREYDYEDYLKLFGVVFQDFTMFEFSVGQNISVSRVYDENKIWNCLKQVHLEKIVKEMPNRLETSLSSRHEDGIDVSGGERQKLAIARAIYKEAPIMILDEPTATLDPISECEIYKHFEQLTQNKTSLFITHRMSSCRFCDDILVFDSGKILERGSHEELLQQRKLYFELWNAQAKYYQKENGNDDTKKDSCIL